MIQKIMGGGISGLSTTQFHWWFPPAGVVQFQTAYQSGEVMVFGKAGTLKNWNVRFQGTPQNPWYLKVYHNGSATSMAITAQSPGNTWSDTTHTISISPGDWITIYAYWNSGPISTMIPSWWFDFDTTDDETMLLGDPWYEPTAGAGAYYPLLTGEALVSTNMANHQQVMPTAGTLQNLYLHMTTAPAAGTSRTFTVNVNGVDTGLTVTISSGTTGSDTTHTVHVAAGDLVCMHETTSGSPGQTFSSWSCGFLPDIAGEQLVMAAPQASLNITADAYNCLYGVTHSAYTWSTSEGARYQYSDGVTIGKLYVRVITAPGSGASWTFAVRAAAASVLSVTLSGTDTSGSNTADQATLSAGDLVDMLASPSTITSPVTTILSWSLVINPGSSAKPKVQGFVFG